MRIRELVLTLAIALFLVAPVRAEGTASPSLLIHNGDKIAFLGDSITAGGARPGGYVTLAMEALKKEGLEVTPIPAGVSGNRSPDMLARLDKDVISKQPTWMVLSCGVNDVWHFKLKLGARTFTGVPLEDYKKYITQIIEQTRAAKIKVIVLTSTMIGEDPESELNKMLIPYNDFLREIAKEKALPLADLNKDMQALLKTIPDVKGKARMFGDPQYSREIQNKLTSDGCHMNKRGNIMMARGVLKAMGLSDEKLTALEKSWLDTADSAGKGKDNSPRKK